MVEEPRTNIEVDPIDGVGGKTVGGGKAIGGGELVGSGFGGGVPRRKAEFVERGGRKDVQEADSLSTLLAGLLTFTGVFSCWLPVMSRITPITALFGIAGLIFALQNLGVLLRLRFHFLHLIVGVDVVLVVVGLVRFIQFAGGFG